MRLKPCSIAWHQCRANPSTRRRYVIRVRAETDQFLLSCVELGTFVKWLECLFAAIDVAAPIDDRDFPRDQSIPRIQRIRWFRGQSPARTNNIAISTPRPPNPQPRSGSTSTAANNPSRRGSDSSESSSTTVPSPQNQQQQDDEASSSAPVPPRIDPINRLSVSSYPNDEIDALTGKWHPEHAWSNAHDMLYAKLCYSVLHYQSPRKSNYIISKGKQWFVDWGTGRMIRVLPPGYGEVELFGPWQIIQTENRRI
jgi:hypothetical protein